MTDLKEGIEKLEEAKGRELSEALQEKTDERINGDKTIFLKMTVGKRPDVTFTGFWSGKFIRAAMDSISRSYRLRRNSASRPIGRKEVQVQKPAEGSKGDDRRT